MKSVTPNSVNLYEICERLNDIWWILGWKSASVEDNFKPCWERPTRLNSTQLNSTEIAQFAESWKFSEVVWVELSWDVRSEHAENSSKLVVTQFAVTDQ